jgi:DNA invertase Pin-like site-specific DNA recombinase
MQNGNKTAIYCRLSRDEDQMQESNSIASQRLMLTDFANRQGFNIVSEYVDDGYSGTNYDRPDFKRMIEDAECGKIDVIITKDLSRLGRDYLTTGECGISERPPMASSRAATIFSAVMGASSCAAFSDR